MSRHILQLVTTGFQPLDQVRQILESCPSEMIDILQIREKAISARDLVQWFHACSVVLPTSAIIINDRVDVAASVEAAGVQLAYHSLAPEQARKALTKPMKLGCSVHSTEEAIIAYQGGADFIIFGHIFTSPSKPDLQPQGLEALAKLVTEIDLPVIAIGGIQINNLDEVLSTGCAGIAVMSSVFQHSNPSEQVSRFRSVLDNSQYKPRHPLYMAHDN